MKAEDNTRKPSIAGPAYGRDRNLTPDISPWGADAVPLDVEERERRPARSARHADGTPRCWNPLATIVCTIALIAALSANLIGGDRTPRTETPQIKPPKERDLANKQPANETRTRRIAQQQHQTRPKPRQRPITSLPPTHSAPDPTYAPAPEPTSASEPVAPTPASVPAPTATTSPKPASGSAVAREFGFEH
jgi:hypothetical protein